MARGDTWSRVECEAIVADYIDMLSHECRGEPFSKAEHRRVLQEKLNNRSEGSIEFKHQNISAILLEEGHVYIRGYLPAKNYQRMLREVVVDRLSIRGNDLVEQEDKLNQELGMLFDESNFEEVLVAPPEKKITPPKKGIVSEPALGYTARPRRIDYAAREARNRQLGERGEEFALEYEKFRLRHLGRDDLLSDVEWTSKERGDGAGYDIRSFDGQTDNELFIEVKTTNSGIYQPFLITQNEVAFSEERGSQYALYRLFSFSRNPHMFSLPGCIKQHVALAPQLYRAEVKK